MKDERALIEKLASDLRERFPKTTEKWEIAPPSLALMGPQSSVAVEHGKVQILNFNRHELPFVISIPHSGLCFPTYMKENLLDDVIFSNIDWYLTQLYSFLDELGFTTIINNISRYVIDPNRNTGNQGNGESYTTNAIYTQTTFGYDIYKRELNDNEISERINEFYVPYHLMIKKAIQEKLKYFEKVYLIDLHSFGRNLGVDVILGNNNGKTMEESFVEYLEKLLRNEGFRTKRNNPYSGGYITKRYKDEFTQCETLQIELWYGSYIDKREFGNEEFPTINKTVFLNAQQGMRNFFENVKMMGTLLKK